MKAIVQERYGSPDDLALREVDKPAPADGEVLVRVHAAAVNARDWHVMRGDPYLARLAMPKVFGFNAPKRRIRGSDVAGRVEAVGKGVTRFRPGDEVYGDVCDMDGAFAEYVCVPDGQVEHKPANLTFEQAAAVPMAGCTALVGLRDVARVTAGQRILINGASGGVGTFAVQIARAFGAEVTAVCSTRNVELVESLGADRVIDYTKEDFAQDGQRYHMVFDLVANRTLADLRRVLTADGVLLLSGGGVSRNGRPHVTGPMGLQIKAQVAARFARHRLTSLMGMAPRAEHLATLRELIESGKVVPAIDRTFTLAEVPEAIRYLEVEHARAKVVITV
ncbi:NAD(P)-dependent alcohol dehydrogenase [Phytohabitans sp. LJ34]|uniref:NAD(P)-dependent alcohol dehydrogenase n=1 Tax=Phytohabitans sp. LJ34 TaxID=3452217 RepID=UPI003F8AD245